MIESLISFTIPLLLAALGGLYSEKAGVLNISLEGLMLSSAFFAVFASSATGSLWAGVLAGIGIALLLTGLFAFSALVLKSDPFVTGLGINMLAYPLVTTFSRIIFNTEGTVRPENMPEVPGLFFPVLSLIMLSGTILFFSRSNPGRLIRLCGGNQERLREKGHSPARVKAFALMTGAVLAGISGAALSLPLGVYVPGMSAGKGWIALVAIYLGAGRPVGILPAVLIFSLFDLWAVNLQQFHRIPTDLVLSAPYFLTLIMALFINYIKNRINNR